MLRDRIFEVVNNVIHEKLSDIDIDYSMLLSDISLDSITFIQLIVELESSFEIEFDDEMLLITAFPTIGSMVEYVESKILNKFENT